MPEPVRLLIVDDDPLNRMMLSYGVQQQGYVPFGAESGRQALAMLREGSYDIVLLDLLMPEMDGFEVLAEIKADPSLRSIPVIMVSALDEIDSVVRCIEMGAEDYLPKPYNPVLLQARLGACAAKKRWRDQELEYLQHVAKLTAAAAEIEGSALHMDAVAEVAQRDDELGLLARVLQRAAGEVRAREASLLEQVQLLSIQIDQAKRDSQVAEVTESEFFQQLQNRASDLRRRRASRSHAEFLDHRPPT